VELIPRMQKLIAENYPGRGVMIGEYNFGAEQHMSGGLAVAEALGRFAQGGVRAAFYWTYPPDRSPAFWAFRAYRNFDGAGGHFLEESLPTRPAPPGVVALRLARPAGQPPRRDRPEFAGRTRAASHTDPHRLRRRDEAGHLPVRR
jgi:hypothetical protein